MGMKTKIDAGQGTQFKFEKRGQKLDGYYVGSFEHNGDYGPTLKHLIQNEKGLWTVFGQKHLISMLEGIPTGCRVVIKYIDDRASKKKGYAAMKLFEVQYDEEDTIDTSSAATSATAEVDEPDYEDDVPTFDESDNSYDDEESSEEEEAPAPVKAAPRPPAQAKPAARPNAAPVSPEAKARAAALLGKRA